MEKTKALIAELNTFSVKTPFEPAEVRRAGQSLLAFRNTAEEIPGILQMLGDAAAGSGAPLNELVRVFNKVKSTGRLTAETFEQFAERGVNLRVELQDMLGKTGEEMVEMQKKGEISFDLVNQAFRRMTGEGGLFFGAMEKQSTSLTGLLSTLRGSFDNVRKQLGEALLPVAKAVTTQLIALADKFTAMNEATGGALAKVAAITLAVGTLAGAFRTLNSAVTLVAGKGIPALTKALLFSPAAPFIAAGIAIAGVIAGLAAVVKWLSTIPRVQQAWRLGLDRLIVAWEQVKVALQAVRDLVVSVINTLITSLNRTFGTSISNMKNGFIDFVTSGIDFFTRFVLHITSTLETLRRTWSATWTSMGKIVKLVLRGQLRAAAAEVLVAGTRIAGVKSQIDREVAQRLEQIRRDREKPKAEEKTTPEEVKEAAKVKIELPTGRFGIEELANQFQQRELDALKPAMETAKNTATIAEKVTKLADSPLTPAFSVASG